MAKLTVQKRSFAVLDYEIPGIFVEPKSPQMGFVLWLIGSESSKDKHVDSLMAIAKGLNIRAFSFDYSGHGDAPFELGATTPAQHFLEVISIYDTLCAEFGCGGGVVIGGSYGSFMLLQLLKYRQVTAGILRAPALLKSSSFYTRWENLVKDENLHWRLSEAEISEHPLLQRAHANKAPILVLAHGRDEVIPKSLPKLVHQKLANSSVVTVKGLAHSLSTASEAQREDYNQQLVQWLATVLQKRSKQ